jgi:hypothetical protein
LHNQNAAITRRFNEAVAIARGEFVSFLYSDDFYLPHKLERQVAQFDGLPADYGVVYAPLEILNASTGQRWMNGSIGASGWVLRSLFLEHERGQLDMISPLVRRAALVEYPFFEDIFAEGEGVFYRLAMTWRFHYDAVPVAVSRDHAGNAGKAIERNAEFTWAWLGRLESDPKFPMDLMPALRTYRATLLRNYGWQSVRVGGNPVYARECFAEAFRVEWQTAMHPRVFAGYGMSWLPTSVRAKLNRYVNTLRGVRGNASYVADFGGAGARKKL